MSRNPVAAYTHRGGFRMGQVEFKDFLWEALLDPAPRLTHGRHRGNLAAEYQITRAEVDAFAVAQLRPRDRGADFPRTRDRRR